MSDSQLVGGNIPAHTVCPFRDECEIARGGVCHHMGLEHTVEFSCAVARGFDMLSKYSYKD